MTKIEAVDEMFVRALISGNYGADTDEVLGQAQLAEAIFNGEVDVSTMDTDGMESLIRQWLGVCKEDIEKAPAERLVKTRSEKEYQDYLALKQKYERGEEL